MSFIYSLVWFLLVLVVCLLCGYASGFFSKIEVFAVTILCGACYFLIKRVHVPAFSFDKKSAYLPAGISLLSWHAIDLSINIKDKLEVVVLVKQLVVHVSNDIGAFSWGAGKTAILPVASYLSFLNGFLGPISIRIESGEVSLLDCSSSELCRLNICNASCKYLSVSSCDNQGSNVLKSSWEINIDNVCSWIDESRILDIGTLSVNYVSADPTGVAVSTGASPIEKDITVIASFGHIQLSVSPQLSTLVYRIVQPSLTALQQTANNTTHRPLYATDSYVSSSTAHYERLLELLDVVDHVISPDDNIAAKFPRSTKLDEMKLFLSSPISVVFSLDINTVAVQIVSEPTGHASPFLSSFVVANNVQCTVSKKYPVLDNVDDAKENVLETSISLRGVTSCYEYHEDVNMQYANIKRKENHSDSLPLLKCFYCIKPVKDTRHSSAYCCDDIEGDNLDEGVYYDSVEFRKEALFDHCLEVHSQSWIDISIHLESLCSVLTFICDLLALHNGLTCQNKMLTLSANNSAVNAALTLPDLLLSLSSKLIACPSLFNMIIIDMSIPSVSLAVIKPPATNNTANPLIWQVLINCTEVHSQVLMVDCLSLSSSLAMETRNIVSIETITIVEQDNSTPLVALSAIKTSIMYLSPLVQDNSLQEDVARVIVDKIMGHSTSCCEWDDLAFGCSRTPGSNISMQTDIHSLDIVLPLNSGQPSDYDDDRKLGGLLRVGGMIASSLLSSNTSISKITTFSMPWPIPMINSWRFCVGVNQFSALLIDPESLSCVGLKGENMNCEIISCLSLVNMVNIKLQCMDMYHNSRQIGSLKFGTDDMNSNISQPFQSPDKTGTTSGPLAWATNSPANFSYTSFPAVAVYRSLDSSLIGILSFRVSAQCSAVSIDVDTVTMPQLMQSAASCTRSFERGMALFSTSFQSCAWWAEYNNSSMPAPALSRSVCPQPTFFAGVSVESLQLNFHLDSQAVCLVSFKSLELFKVSFSGHCDQVNGSAKDFTLSDVSLKCHHEVLISSLFGLCPTPSLNIGNSNFIEFHCSSIPDESALLEVKADFLRVTYVHRSLCTLLSYFQDHFAPVCKFPKDLFPLCDSSITDDTVDRGMFRIVIQLNHSEVHLPVSSNGCDAIVIICQSIDFHKTVRKLGSNVVSPPSEHFNYCMGPWLHRQKWISEYARCKELFECINIRQYARNILFSGVDLNNDSSIESVLDSTRCNEYDVWLLLDGCDALCSPNDFVDNPAEYFFTVGLSDASLCSWCNMNLIGESIDLTCDISMVGTRPFRPCVYDEVFSALGFESSKDGELLNQLTFDIYSKDVIELTISQGQYMAIVHLIQQNFSELQELVPDVYYYSTPMQAPLSGAGIGRYECNNLINMASYSILSLVRIDLPYAHLTALENSPEFYDRYRKAMKRLLVRDCIPSWSSHFKYRDEALYKWFGSHGNSGADKSVRFSLGGKEEHHFHYDRHHPQMRKTSTSQFIRQQHVVAFITMQDLSLDIYRMHHEGGSGLELSTSKITVTAPNDNSGMSNVSNSVPNTSSSCRSHAPHEKSTLVANIRHFNELQEQRTLLLSPVEVPNLMKCGNDVHNSQQYVHHQGNFGSSYSHQFHHSYSSGKYEHMRYSQQAVKNLRSCKVFIDKCAAFAQLKQFSAVVAFFVDPIHMTDQRNLDIVTAKGLGPFDFMVLLDLEIHLFDSILCLPNASNGIESTPYTTSVSSQSENERVLCFHVDASFSQNWRGCLQSGPGSIQFDLAVDLHSIYIAPTYEIQCRTVTSLLDPVHFNVHMNYAVLPPKSQFAKHLSELTTLYSIPSFMHSKGSSRSKFRFISISVTRMYAEVASFADGCNEIVQFLRLRLSLQDISFLYGVFCTLQRSIYTIKIRPPIAKQYSYFFNSFEDINHLPLLMHYQKHVDIDECLNDSMDRTEITFHGCDLELLLRNNTYNLNIFKIDLQKLLFDFNETNGVVHMSSSINVSWWVFNDSINSWEPLVEQFEANGVALSDTTYARPPVASVSADEEVSVTVPFSSSPFRLRADVYSFPINVNVTQSMLSNLYNKLTLVDAVTTNSVHLPPYKVINEIGVAVSCSFYLGKQLLTEGSISADSFLSIEIDKLTSNKRRHSNISSMAFISSKQEGEYLMTIQFTVHNITYLSKNGISVDKEGLYEFDICELMSRNSDLKPHKRPSSRNFGDNSEVFQPVALLSVTINKDGGRELKLRSMLLLVNDTVRPIHCSIQVPPPSTDTQSSVVFSDEMVGSIKKYLLPGQEWQVPVTCCHPYASVSIMLGNQYDVKRCFESIEELNQSQELEVHNWCKIVPALCDLVAKGTWHAPSKLNTEILSLPDCANPLLFSSSQSLFSLAMLQGNNKLNWGVYVKPSIARKKKRSTSTGNGFMDEVPLRLANEVDRSRMGGKSTTRRTSLMKKMSSMVLPKQLTYQSLSLHILSPIQLCNFLPQPILYRLRTDDRSNSSQNINSSTIFAEGTLVPNNVLDIHDVEFLFLRKILISVRLLNYGWSDWVQVFGVGDGFKSTKVTVETILSSLALTIPNNLGTAEANDDISLPKCSVSVHVNEQMVSFSGSMWISNRTGFPLDICESSSHRNFCTTQTTEDVAGDEEDLSGSENGSTEDSDAEEAQTATTLNNLFPAVDAENSGSECNSASDVDETQNLVTLTIFLPANHRESINVEVPRDWTLSQVFRVVIQNPLVGNNHYDAIEMGKAIHQEILNNFNKTTEKRQRKVDVPESDYVFLSNSTADIEEFINRSSMAVVDEAPATSSLVSPVSDNTPETLGSGLTASSEPTPATDLSESAIHNSPPDTSRRPSIPDVPKEGFVRRLSKRFSFTSSSTSTPAPATPPTPAQADDGCCIPPLTQGGSPSSVGTTTPEVSGIRKERPKSISRDDRPKSLSREERPQSISRDGESGIDNGDVNEFYPPAWGVGFITPCVLSSLVPMEVTVGTLTGGIIRLCHKAEWQIFRQVCNLTGTFVAAEGRINRALGRQILQYKTAYIPFEGDVPFSPPQNKLLRNLPSLSVRVSQYHHVDKELMNTPFHFISQWSEPAKVYRSTFGEGGVPEFTHCPYVDLTSLVLDSSSQSASWQNAKCFEFGLYPEHGSGEDMRATTVVSIVPRYILISQLPFDIAIRPIPSTSDISEDTSDVFYLQSGANEPFFFPNKARAAENGKSLLHIACANFRTSFEWTGEIDVSTSGLMYTRLRSPHCVIKVQVEIVAGSIVSTFSIVNKIWPPYRIDNITPFYINFGQYVKNGPMQYGDELPPKSAVAYAYDFPFTGTKFLSMHASSFPAAEEDPMEDDCKAFKISMEGEDASYTQFVTLSNGPSDQPAAMFDLPLPSESLYLETTEIFIEGYLSCTLIATPECSSSAISKDFGKINKNIVYNDYTFERLYGVLQKNYLLLFSDNSKDKLVDVIPVCFSASSALSCFILDAVPEIVQFGSYNMNEREINLENDLLSKFDDVAPDTSPSKKTPKRMSRMSGFGVSSSFKRRHSWLDSPPEEVDSDGIIADNAIARIERDVVFSRYVLYRIALGLKLPEKCRMSVSTVETEFIERNFSFFMDKILQQQHTGELEIFGLEIVTALQSIFVLSNESCSLRILMKLVQLEYLVVFNSKKNEKCSPDMSLFTDAESSVSTAIPFAKDNDLSVLVEENEVEQSLSDDLLEQQFVFVEPSRKVPSSLIISPSKGNAPLSTKSFFSFTTTTQLAMSDGEEKPTSDIRNIKQNHRQYLFEFQYEFDCNEWARHCQEALEASLLNHHSCGRNAIYEESLPGSLLSSLYRYHSDTRKSNLRNIGVGSDQSAVKAKLSLKTRSEGPTKVLEIREVPISKDETQLTVEECSSDTPVPQSLIAPSMSAVTVTIVVDSVSISLIDNEPVELVFLRMHDIDMSIVREVRSVSMSVTVQHFQIDNQLMNPEYPIFIRPCCRDAALQDLKLPGLLKSGLNGVAPSIHMYFKQIYHEKSPFLDDCADAVHTDRLQYLYTDNLESDGLPSSSKEADSDTEIDFFGLRKLLYFDVAALWISPMEIKINEEMFVRVIRVFQMVSLERKQRRANRALPSFNNWKNYNNGYKYGIDYNSYHQLRLAGSEAYSKYCPDHGNSLRLCFHHLKLYPLDVTLFFRPSPGFLSTDAELGYLQLVDNLHAARLCLSPLRADNIFGSVSFILNSLGKHYKASLFRQFHKIIGTTDLVEGTVGIVANVGTGVYDLFHEPIDGLLDDNGTFLTGLSKGGRSMASKTIGGTSAFASKITGGIGKGVSLLTMDNDFQNDRTRRRFQRTHNVSHGVYVGTTELGKNIIDGVTGIVTSPYRGYEQGGTVGFGVGVAKGILGVALKPAVGVFDFASRTTEGIRNTAFGSSQELNDNLFDDYYAGGMSNSVNDWQTKNEDDADDDSHSNAEPQSSSVCRIRLPRSFGQDNQLAHYDLESAAAQYIADKLTGFNRNMRCKVIHHQYLKRYFADSRTGKERTIASLDPWITGFPDSSLLVLMTKTRALLVSVSNVSGVHLVLSCPGKVISGINMGNGTTNDDQLTIKLSNPIFEQGIPNSKTSSWNSSDENVSILHPVYTDFMQLQILMEMTFGEQFPRQHVLLPNTLFTKNSIASTDVCTDFVHIQETEGVSGSTYSAGSAFHFVQKKLSGIRRVLSTPTYHTYIIHGHALYEYSTSYITSKTYNAVTSDGAALPPSDEDSDNHKHDDVYMGKILQYVFKNRSGSNGRRPSVVDGVGASGKPNMLQKFSLSSLSAVYPLLDIDIVGPLKEDNGKFLLSLSCKTGLLNRRNSSDQSMGKLKRQSIDTVNTDSLLNMRRKSYTEPTSLPQENISMLKRPLKEKEDQPSTLSDNQLVVNPWEPMSLVFHSKEEVSYFMKAFSGAVIHSDTVADESGYQLDSSEPTAGSLGFASGFIAKEELADAQESNVKDERQNSYSVETNGSADADDEGDGMQYRLAIPIGTCNEANMESLKMELSHMIFKSREGGGDV